VRQYRIAAGQSVAEMAARVGISKAMLSKIENAQTSCSLTTLGRLASGLNVPVTALFRGVDAEREAVHVPAGHGTRIVRRGSRVGHLYQLLGALRGSHKRMEAVLVTLTEASYPMRPGDALQLDGEGTHGPQELVTLPIRLLSVTAYGDHVPG
jgi:transcriptional regulator with XRE-family HTH domain